MWQDDSKLRGLSQATADASTEVSGLHGGRRGAGAHRAESGAGLAGRRGVRDGAGWL